LNILAWATLALLLPACGNAPAPPAPPGVVLPVAVAGDDQEVLVLAAVALSALGSSDPGGGVPAYLWTQTAGTPVVLTGAATAAAGFTSPVAAETLTFRLDVTGAQGTSSDTVNVVVKTLRVTAPDTLFIGYGKTTSTLIAAAPQGGAGGNSFLWTGMPAWMKVADPTAQTLDIVSTPALTDFQNFIDAPGVAMLQGTTQGRVQLVVTVQDSGGAVDDEVVNVSVGPFPNSAANENLALGEPVFLNGGQNATTPVTGWTWSITGPTGVALTTAQIFKPDKTALGAAPDQRFVYFVPNLIGPWTVIVTQTPGGPKTFELTVGKFIGVGNLVGNPPDPFAGECAACHAGQYPFLADFTNPWSQTRHATAMSRLLDPADPLYAEAQAKLVWQDLFDFLSSPFSVDQRAPGFSLLPGQVQDGWAHRAASEKVALAGLTWSELVRKHPRTAAMSNVQCESCHGPGSQHAGDSTGIRKSFDANLCGRCHAGTEQLWEASGHGIPVQTSAGASGAASSSCNGCHTAQGFVVEMRAQEGADPHQALYAFGNLSRPVIPPDDRRGTTCQACHDPHKPTANRPPGGRDPQLRAWGDVVFRNGAVGRAGPAAVCFMCHQSRTDIRPSSVDFTGRRAPHDSTAAEVLSNTGGAEFAGWTYAGSPHADPARFLSPGGTNRSCLACHQDIQPDPTLGEDGLGALGGHTFHLSQGSGSPIATQGTHTAGTATAAARSFRVGSGPSFLRRIFPGDTLEVTTGVNAGKTFTVESIPGARELILKPAPAVADGADTDWELTSVKKHNMRACTQCHLTADEFRVSVGNYDGLSGLQPVQDEIAGLLLQLETALKARLQVLVAPPMGSTGLTFLASSGRIRYTYLPLVGPAVTKIFPGPSVSESGGIDWTLLTPSAQAEWTAAYKAAYNHFFAQRDKSGGIHNTGYIVNLLHSSLEALGVAVLPAQRYQPN
jgi:hypothetical protein